MFNLHLPSTCQEMYKFAVSFEVFKMKEPCAHFLKGGATINQIAFIYVAFKCSVTGEDL